MKSRGKLISVTRNITNNRLSVTFEIDSSAEEITSFADQDLSIEVKKFNPKRTLTANAYYWSLIGKICDCTRSTNSEIHNMMLRSYGTLEEMDGRLIEILIPDTPEAFQKVLGDEMVHLKPTSNIQACEDGIMRRTYCMIKPSHSYTKEEFSRLLEGTIQEARDIGIETMPPEEIARLRWLSGEK